MKSKRKNGIQRAKDFGIDVSLLYENLKYTPSQRVDRHENVLEFVEELKKAGKRHRGEA